MELFSERDGGILKAILLGDKSSLREEDQLLYQKNGISHILAISGLHISMIGTGLYGLLRKGGLTFWEAGIPSGMVMICYGMMTGFGISTIRAVCMFLVMLGGEITGKAYDMASAMSLAAILILCENPLQARQAGFLLSFGAVLGICLVYPVLETVFGTKKKWSRALLFSISLTLVTGPLSIHFFYEYPLYSMLLNFIVIPFMPLVMGSAAAAMFVGMKFLTAGRILGLPAYWVLSGYEFLGEQTVKLPRAVISFGAEEPWQLILYYVLLFGAIILLWYGKRRIYVMLIPFAAVLVLLRFRSPLEFTMMDVGQGDGMLLRLSKDTTCLIDGGSTNVKNVGTYRILPYLKYEGIDALDFVIFTHLDEDHVNGVRELIQMHGTMDGVEIECLLFPDIANPDEKYVEMWELAVKQGIRVEKIGAGDQLCGEKWELVCLSPVKGSVSGDKNESSTVLQLKFGEFSMLLTGDLGESGEEMLYREGVLEDIDVWKVSHHGSKYSGSTQFLEQILPNVSLISVGKNNYGHPSADLLDRLEAVGSNVWSTLDEGAIMLESDGERYGITLQSTSD
jgi:competence protein ComEC